MNEYVNIRLYEYMYSPQTMDFMYDLVEEAYHKGKCVLEVNDVRQGKGSPYGKTQEPYAWARAGSVHVNSDKDVMLTNRQVQNPGGFEYGAKEHDVRPRGNESHS